MSDFEKEDFDGEDNDESIVVMTDEEGNEYYYREEMILPIGDKRYAILIPIDVDEEEGEECGCGCGCECSEDDAYIARVDVDENGEEIYVDPSDEEFELVRRAYEEMFDEEAEEE